MREEDKYEKRSIAASLRRMGCHCALLMLLMWVVYIVKFGGLSLAGSDFVVQLGDSQASYDGCAVSQDAVSRSYDRDIQHFLFSMEPLRTQIMSQQFKQLIEIEKLSEAELPYSAYRDNEAAGVPIVVKNLSSLPKMWDREHIRQVCGKEKVSPMIPDKPSGGRQSQKWAGLVNMAPISVEAFFAALDKKASPSPYMHDWAIPKNCPQLLENYTVPQYLSRDVLRHVEIPVQGFRGKVGLKTRPYENSWPSLFVGEASTGSGMHIDSGDTHFVMYMIEGVKEFRILKRQDRIVAYEDRSRSFFSADLFNPNFTAHPLLALATVYHVTLYPGDMLFIPAGSPHQVINHSPIIGISTNYVDDTNIATSIGQFREQYSFDVSEGLQKIYDEQAPGTVPSDTSRSVPWKTFVKRGRRST